MSRILFKAFSVTLVSLPAGLQATVTAKASYPLTIRAKI
jgi:hypothetical protein